MGYNPQESLENTINTMGTLLGLHPIVLWTMGSIILKLNTTPSISIHIAELPRSTFRRKHPAKMPTTKSFYIVIQETLSDSLL